MGRLYPVRGFGVPPITPRAGRGRKLGPESARAPAGARAALPVQTGLGTTSCLNFASSAYTAVHQPGSKFDRSWSDPSCLATRQSRACDARVHVHAPGGLLYSRTSACILIYGCFSNLLLASYRWLPSQDQCWLRTGTAAFNSTYTCAHLAHGAFHILKLANRGALHDVLTCACVLASWRSRPGCRCIACCVVPQPANAQEHLPSSSSRSPHVLSIMMY